MVGTGGAPFYVAGLYLNIGCGINKEAIRVATHEAFAVARTLVIDTTLVSGLFLQRERTFSGVSPPTNAPFSLVQRILWK